MDRSLIEPRSGGIFIAQGESASPGYAIKKTHLALKARKNRRAFAYMVETRFVIMVLPHSSASYALSGLGAFWIAHPRVRRLTPGYKYSAATRFD